MSVERSSPTPASHGTPPSTQVVRERRRERDNVSLPSPLHFTPFFCQEDEGEGATGGALSWECEGRENGVGFDKLVPTNKSLLGTFKNHDEHTKGKMQFVEFRTSFTHSSLFTHPRKEGEEDKEAALEIG